METELTGIGYSITRNSVSQEFIENIRRELYVKPLENPNFDFGDSKEYPVFRLSKTKIYIPRYYGITEYGIPLKNSVPPGTPIDLNFVGSLREVQQTTIDETLKAFESVGGGLVSLDTGLGKTVVALKLISLMKLKTLVVVHAEFLLEQWIERIKEYLPNARIGVMRQDKCVWEDVDIVVGMIQSIVKRDYPKDAFRSFGMMTIDETHHVSSRTFSSIFFKVQTKYMIGLSATPERKDGLSKVIYWFLGPQIVHIKRETNKPSISIVVNDCTDYEEKINKIGKVNIPVMITDLTTKNKRNELIIEQVISSIEENRKILILTERRNHAELLVRTLIDKGISAGLYLGGMKQVTRTDSVTKSVIVGTYQASGEGFDVPDLDTLILSTPKSDVEQAVGRILRRVNKNEPVVIDIVDMFSIFKGQYYKRRRFYKSQGFDFI
jgi:superfamily II DNA or RNA helicase